MFRKHALLTAAATLAVAGSASAYTIDPGSTLIPAGLSAGDSFQLVFQTSSTVVGNSIASPSVIANWNAHVNSVADGSSLADIPGINWFAILSTTTTDAKDNAVVSAPVYLLDSPTAITTLIAADATDMWDGTIGAPITYDESANLLPGRRAWAGGSWTVGVGAAGVEVGSTGTWHVGNTNASGTAFPNAWLGGSGATSQQDPSTAHAVYAMSEVITVAVPEPGSLALLGLGGLAVARRRRG